MSIDKLEEQVNQRAIRSASIGVFTGKLPETHPELEPLIEKVNEVIDALAADNGVTPTSTHYITADGKVNANLSALDAEVYNIAGPSNPFGIINRAQQSLSGAGVVTVSEFFTAFTSTDTAQALTLADGTFVGQLKKIYHITDGGSGVLTPAHPSGFSTITFTAAGDYAVLQWNGTNWKVVEYVGATVA